MNETLNGLPGIAPFAEAEGQFLEVMLNKFRLTRNANGGLTLSVSFDDDTPAVRKRTLRDDIRCRLPDFDSKARAYQKELNDFSTGEGEGVYLHDDAEFPFRFCSGGAIPMVSMGGVEYYCFNWRDIRPVGWNLANGGSESRSELLYPKRIISRELCEEMLVFWPAADGGCASVRGRLSFDNVLDHPDPDLVWGLWTTKLGHQFQWSDTQTVEVRPVPLGTDKLQITFADKPRLVMDNIILNINALDNGIEVDRLVKLDLPDNAVICDGEIIGGRLLNSVMGLFEVNRFNEAFRNGCTEFQPDRFFFDGQCYSGRMAFDEARMDFIDNKRRNGLLSTRDERDYRAAVDAGLEFDLCPATRTALRRCLRKVQETGSTHGQPAKLRDIFLSFASEDIAHARRAATFLKQQGFEPFFSADYRGGTDFMRAINQALTSARCFVTVTSKIDHLSKEWLEYESGTFKVLDNRGDKPGGLFFTVVVGIKPGHLPPPYCTGTAIPCDDKTSMESALQTVVEFLRRASP